MKIFAMPKMDTLLKRIKQAAFWGAVAGLIIGFAEVYASGSEMPEEGNTTAIWGMWKSTDTVSVNCPDPKSDIDPQGEFVVISKTVRTKDGSVTVARPTVLYPKSTVCDYQVEYPNKRFFKDTDEANAFKAKCGEACREWSMRFITVDEMVDLTLENMNWQITHVPGGDRYSYPDGVYQVWAKDERLFNRPLGVGPSRQAAIVKAMREMGYK